MNPQNRPMKSHTAHRQYLQRIRKNTQPLSNEELRRMERDRLLEQRAIRERERDARIKQMRITRDQNRATALKTKSQSKDQKSLDSFLNSKQESKKCSSTKVNESKNPPTRKTNFQVVIWAPKQKGQIDNDSQSSKINSNDTEEYEDNWAEENALDLISLLDNMEQTIGPN